MRHLTLAAVLALTAAPALAQTAAPSAPAAGSPASASAPASSTALAVGQSVKDKTGVVIGAITELKPDASGQTATIKMGEQAFAIGASSLVVVNGAAVINATQAELKAMVAKAGGAG